ncbi:MAG: hypothetical protein P8048_01080, partial [Calditrichia bacterium]
MKKGLLSILGPAGFSGFFSSSGTGASPFFKRKFFVSIATRSTARLSTRLVSAYGLYQPAAYAGVKRYTNPQTAAMGYAVIYSLMNLGAFIFGPISSFTRHHFESVFPPNGLSAVFWVLVGITFLSLVLTLIILTKRVDKRAVER